jgi:hypothetical protein
MEAFMMVGVDFCDEVAGPPVVMLAAMFCFYRQPLGFNVCYGVPGTM